MGITAKQYAQALFDLTDGKSDSETEIAVSQIVKFLAKNGKLKLAGKIAEKFSEIYNRKHGTLDAEVATSHEIGGKEEKKIVEFIKAKYDSREVSLKKTLDKSLKGGVVVRVGDEVMDGSVRGKLTDLRRFLTD